MDGPSLPRSIRWRIQLGLLGLPPSPSSTPNDNTTTNNSDDDDISYYTLEDLYRCNSSLLQHQRRRYQQLVDKHNKQQHAAKEALSSSQDTDDAPPSGESESASATATAAVHEQRSTSTATTVPAEAAVPPVVLDPLTAMVREQEAQDKRKQQLYLKYRKERARRNRGIVDFESDNNDGGGTSHNGSTGGTTTASHHQYQSSSLEVIDKDLHRLQPEHFTYHHSRKRLLLQEQQQQQQQQTHQTDKRNATNDSSFDTSVEERTARLAQLLIVHATEHDVLGYRQGMHEIASYLLLVLEMDLYDMETSNMQSLGTTTTKVTVNEDAKVDDDEHSTTSSSSSLLDASCLVHDAYTIFERVMASLAPAYDIKQSASLSSRSHMEAMGRSVVLQLKNVVADQALYDVVRAMHCPPELYCTRWVRLMFSREVLGWRNVLLLWDIFFDLITCHEDITSMDVSKYSKPDVSPRLRLGRFTLMQVLESTAASMILLQREALLQADHNESIHVLMNVPPLKNVLPLTATLLSLTRRIQVGGAAPELQSSSSGPATPSIASLSASFGQMARGAFQQIAPTAGESFRKLYDSTTSSYGLATSSSTTPTPALKRRQQEHPSSSPSLSHPLQAMTTQEQANQEISDKTTSSSVVSCFDLANSLEKSSTTITSYLMKVNEDGGGTREIPEEIWEALAQIETVRQRLILRDSHKDPSKNE